MRVAVVGHVEWVDFITVDRVPAPGEVAHGGPALTRAGGGGAVAAVVLAQLAEHCEFFCALGRDRNGEEAARGLTERGVQLRVAWREQPTRRAVTLLDGGGERTIVTAGERLEPCGSDPLPWADLGDCAGVYLTAGDLDAVHRARAARVLVATPRARTALEDPTMSLDALVFSAEDPDESAWAQRVAARTRLLVATEGGGGGRWSGESSGRWEAVAPEGPVRDSYGAGDSFAAALTYGLAAGMELGAAAALGAEWGARALTVTGTR